MTRSGVALLVVGAVLTALGELLGFTELVAVGAAALAVVALALATILLPGQIVVRRALHPDRVVEGEPLTIRLEFRNVRRLPSLPLMVRETIGPVSEAVSVPSMAGRGSFTTELELRPPLRGRYELPPPDVGRTDPFRLVRRRSTVGEPSSATVHPGTRALDSLPLRGTGDQDGATSPFSPGGGAAFHSLREYQEGDDWRLIHWPSTARTGQVIVRHLVMPDETNQTVVLDTCRDSYGRDEEFHDAVRFAASWCVAAVATGCTVTLLTTAGETARHETAALPGPGTAELLDLLAGVGLTGAARPVAEVVAGLRGVTIGVVTGGRGAAGAGIAVGADRAPLSVVAIGGAGGPATAGVLDAPDLDTAVRRWNAEGAR